ncbi:baseplate central spike complex protein [Bajunvirus bajun]|uniref:Lysozyme n=1 Tax=Brevundimonas phage vB_BgoS-Bajun TaxID=2948594 RepID=A0A9E7N4T4_9CAUD|nr:baseplate central spike complex protein [Brevundimonas phage vB_BgoS-Bajun]
MVPGFSKRVNPLMQVSANGLKLIQAWEGIEDGNPATVDLEPYICPAKVYTVGWGHVLTTPAGAQIDVDVFKPTRARQLAAEAMIRTFGKPAITMAEAEALLRRDVAKFERYVETAIGANNATPAQFDAMVSFTFNCGPANFNASSIKRLHLQGKRTVGDVSLSTMCRESKAKAATNTIPRAFCAWSNANKKWMLGLFRRRVSELLIYGGHDAATALRTAQNFKGC